MISLPCTLECFPSILLGALDLHKPVFTDKMALIYSSVVLLSRGCIGIYEELWIRCNRCSAPLTSTLPNHYWTVHKAFWRMSMNHWGSGSCELRCWHACRSACFIYSPSTALSVKLLVYIYRYLDAALTGCFISAC